MVVENYSHKEYVQHFRLSEEIVDELVENFSKSQWFTDLHLHANSRANITANKHVLLFLWFAGHQSSYRDVADRFNLSLSSVYDVITRVMLYLSNLAAIIINLPTALEKRRTMDFYSQKNGFANVIGSIDGSHIKIEKPLERAVDYINRKGYYSILQQGLYNEYLNFFIGYPGSVHDARVFRNSSLYLKLQTVCEGGYILGDSAYPHLPQMLIPYKDNGYLTPAQRNFNKKFSGCRVSIEHTFGLLKQRFRQLFHLQLRGHKRICHSIRACWTLHNIANKNDVNIFNTEDPVDDNQPDRVELVQFNNAARRSRDEICRQLFLKI